MFIRCKTALSFRGFFPLMISSRKVLYHGSPIIVAVTRTRVLSLILCSGQQLHWGPTLPRFASYNYSGHSRLNPGRCLDLYKFFRTLFVLLSLI